MYSISLQQNETVDGDAVLGACSGEFLKLYSYWETKKLSSRLPARRDLMFDELRPWLGHIILFDVLNRHLPDKSDFRYRLVGSAFTLTINIDPTGRNVSDFCLTADPGAALKNLRAIATNRVPRFCTSMRLCADRRSWTPARIFLPLADDGSNVNIIMMYGGLPLDEASKPRTLPGSFGQ